MSKEEGGGKIGRVKGKKIDKERKEYKKGKYWLEEEEEGEHNEGVGTKKKNRKEGLSNEGRGGEGGEGKKRRGKGEWEGWRRRTRVRA